MNNENKAEEKLDCKKKYLYEYSMFWECNDGCKSQILEDDVVDLLNELFEENGELRKKLREDIAFKDKHISYFQNLIGDIEIEFKLKENLSKEKWEEIHEKNYQNFRFGSGDNER